MSTLKEELSNGVLSRLDPEEPIFVLRARDALAPKAVEAWIKLAWEFIDKSKRKEATDLLAKMNAWQREHPERVKFPD